MEGNKGGGIGLRILHRSRRRRLQEQVNGPHHDPRHVFRFVERNVGRLAGAHHTDAGASPELAEPAQTVREIPPIRQALDGLIAAVSALDHQQPNQFYGNRNRRYARDTVATVTALEARITALGY
jgi:hypothetical protein